MKNNNTKIDGMNALHSTKKWTADINKEKSRNMVKFFKSQVLNIQIRANIINNHKED